MIAWTRFERGWRDALVAAMLPQPRADLPGLARVDDVVFWPGFLRTAPLLVRVGFRTAVWSLTLAPVVRFGRPFHRLTPAQRDEVLQKAHKSRWFLARQLVLVVKVVACLSWGREPAVRAALRVST